MGGRQRVSVPSFGDSFFITALDGTVVIRPTFVSVPSFGDSFFIMKISSVVGRFLQVSVPSFGDSFFMRWL